MEINRLGVDMVYTVYCVKMKHNPLQHVLKHTYFVAVIDGEFCLRMGALHRPEPHSDHHA